MAGKRVLMVEGPDDKHVVMHICGERKLGEIETIHAYGGKDPLLEGIGTRLKESDVIAGDGTDSAPMAWSGDDRRACPRPSYPPCVDLAMDGPNVRTASAMAAGDSVAAKAPSGNPCADNHAFCRMRSWMMNTGSRPGRTGA